MDSAWGLHPWEGARKEERLPHSGNPLQQLGDQPGQEGTSQAQSRVWQPACGRPTEEPRGPWPFLLAAVHSLRRAPAGMHGGWVLKLRFLQKDQERGPGLVWEDNPKGLEFVYTPGCTGGTGRMEAQPRSTRSPLVNARLERGWGSPLQLLSRVLTVGVAPPL